MSNSIELSPKHGVNPCIPICCWCGKEKNEVALLGRIREKNPMTGKTVKGSDVEAPMKCVLDYEPCEECVNKWKDAGAVIVCEVSHTPVQANMPPIMKDRDGSELYPTMSMVGISEDAAERLFGKPIEAGRMTMMEDVAFQNMFSEALKNMQPEVVD